MSLVVTEEQREPVISEPEGLSTEWVFKEEDGSPEKMICSVWGKKHLSAQQPPKIQYYWKKQSKVYQ